MLRQWTKSLVACNVLLFHNKKFKPPAPTQCRWLSANANISLQWRHNDRDGVSNNRRLDCFYSTICSDVGQRKHQISASLAFVWGIHRWPVNSPHKWLVTRKMLPFDDVTCIDDSAYKKVKSHGALSTSRQSSRDFHKTSKVSWTQFPPCYALVSAHFTNNLRSLHWHWGEWSDTEEWEQINYTNLQGNQIT